MFSSLYCRFLPIVCILRRCWKWFPSAHRCSSHLKNTFIACKIFFGWNWRHFSLTVYFQIVFNVRIITVHYPYAPQVKNWLHGFRFGEWGHSPMFIILSSKTLPELPIEYFYTAIIIKGRHFLITVLVFKKWRQNVCNRLVWIVVSVSSMVPVIAFALMTHQMPTLKSCSGMLCSSMELSESLRILLH